MPTKRFSSLSENKKKRISDAVVREFMRTTYGELQISKIARGAEVSRASLYTYFPTREDLYFFALEETRKRRMQDPQSLEDGRFFIKKDSRTERLSGREQA